MSLHSSEQAPHHHQSAEDLGPTQEQRSFGSMLYLEGKGHPLDVLDKHIKTYGWTALEGVAVVAVRRSAHEPLVKATYVVIDFELLKKIKKTEFSKEDERSITKEDMNSPVDKVFGSQAALINAHDPEIYHAHKDIMVSLLTAIKPDQIIVATEELMAKLTNKVGTRKKTTITGLKKMITQWATTGLGGSVIHAELGDRERLAKVQESENSGMILAILAGFYGFINGPRKEIEAHIIKIIESGELSELISKIANKIKHHTGIEPDLDQIAKDYVTVTEVASMASIDTTKSAVLFGLERLKHVQDSNKQFYEAMVVEALSVSGDPSDLRAAVMRGKLTHIQSFVLEVLRTADVVKTSGVKAFQDIPLNATEQIPKGAVVMPGYQPISHNPAYWGGDASFMEERFINNLSLDSITTSDYLLSKDIPFVTFAVEDRSCTGMTKAIIALTIFFTLYLARLGAEFSLTETNMQRMKVGDLVAANPFKESSIKVSKNN